MKEPVKIVPDVLSVPELLHFSSIENLGFLENRLIFNTLYLTGGRVSEVLALRARDLKLDGDALMVFMTTLKNRQRHFRTIPVPLKTIFSEEKRALDELLSYSSKCEAAYGPDYKLFGFIHTRQTINWRFRQLKFTCRGYLKKDIFDAHQFYVYPHYLRHCRLTHLVRNYGFDAMHLTEFAGWSDPKVAMVYVQLTGADLAEKFRNRGKEW